MVQSMAKDSLIDLEDEIEHGEVYEDRMMVEESMARNPFAGEEKDNDYFEGLLDELRASEESTYERMPLVESLPINPLSQLLSTQHPSGSFPTSPLLSSFFLNNILPTNEAIPLPAWTTILACVVMERCFGEEMWRTHGDRAREYLA